MGYLAELEKDLSGLKLAVDYWDVRIEDSFETQINITDGETVSCTATPSVGAFVRVRKNGFWLYEATTELKTIAKTLQGLAQQSVRAGKADAFKAQMHPAFVEKVPQEEKFSHVPMAQKLAFAKKTEELLRSLAKASATTFRYKDITKTKAFLNSVGTKFEYDFNQGGVGAKVTFKEEDLLFEDVLRIYGSQFAQLQIQEKAVQEFGAEALKFLKAPVIAPGKYKVLLDPEVTGVFTHESFGHKSEADFMLGNDEALQEWQLGKKIGADCLTIVDEGGHRRTSGYCPIDDEGTPARKNYLIKNGVLTGRLHSQETAFRMGETPTGNCRALGFEWEPIVRMTSTYIEAGTESRQALLERAVGGILVEGVKHGSGLSTFTIAPLRGYRILPGGKKEPVRLTVISGSVFDTLKNIEAVSSDFNLESSAVGGCGKMEQGPLPISDGGPYVLIKEMQVS